MATDKVRNVVANPAPVNPVLEALFKADPRLRFIFGPLFANAVDFKAKNKRTATWADVVEPPIEIRPMKIDDKTGQAGPYVDSEGNPIHPSRKLLANVVSRYRPSKPGKPVNPNANADVWSLAKGILGAINTASGVKKGRKGGLARPITPEESKALLASVQITAL